MTQGRGATGRRGTTSPAGPHRHLHVPTPGVRLREDGLLLYDDLAAAQPLTVRER
ncbi:hypothetical protein [Streptomyces ipomoeae]|uniref:hypothetical protein n=1 Tax=Streptomyces ipomoeae TaxID=103232 RepID=UPI0002EF6E97|nr:hypothetical protein [Streptomyces ipomoeae]MDX2699833.1 hypothetical protein [Streptomyces ipomoeae]MDX2837680.1 hypothetical protein [Streptomyces ipomoeae]